MSKFLVVDNSLAFILGLECAAVYQIIKEIGSDYLPLIKNRLPFIKESSIRSHINHLTSIGLIESDPIFGISSTSEKTERKVKSSIKYNGVCSLLDVIDSDFDLNQSGVYLIDDVYVGVSNCIENRIRTHISSAINIGEKCKNKQLKLYLRKKILSGKKISVKVLSNKDTFDEERYFIKSFKNKGFNLLNIHNL
jgi:hypothetical protein